MHSGSLGVTLTKRCRRPIFKHVKTERLHVRKVLFAPVISDVYAYLNIYSDMQTIERPKLVIQLSHMERGIPNEVICIF